MRRSVEQRLVHRPALACAEERLLVGGDRAGVGFGRLAGGEPGDRARQAEADDAADLVRVGRGEAGLGEALGHRGADRRLPSLSVPSQSNTASLVALGGRSLREPAHQRRDGRRALRFERVGDAQPLLGRLVLRQLEGRPPCADVQFEADDALREAIPQVLRDVLGPPRLASGDARFLRSPIASSRPWSPSSSICRTGPSSSSAR
jgi:hypothetical protein